MREVVHVLAERGIDLHIVTTNSREAVVNFLDFNNCCDQIIFKVIFMRETSLQEIKKVCNSPAGLKVKKQVSAYMRSKPGYDPERKRSRNPEEA